MIIFIQHSIQKPEIIFINSELLTFFQLIKRKHESEQIDDKFKSSHPIEADL